MVFSKIIHRVRDTYDTWLADMAKENKKTFGSKRMDCCDLNSDENKSHKHVQ